MTSQLMTKLNFIIRCYSFVRRDLFVPINSVRIRSSLSFLSADCILICNCLFVVCLIWRSIRLVMAVYVVCAVCVVHAVWSLSFPWVCHPFASRIAVGRLLTELLFLLFC